jgi:crotonobetainyl-CoA:carnitine CoA-transferase CaiB-like acyl-CoA transferase
VERTDIAEDERFRTRDLRRQHYEALEATLAPVFATKTRSEWIERLEAHDVPAVPLYNVAEVLTDPQVAHLGLTEELEHPAAGKLKFVRGPVKFDGRAEENSTPPPLPGEHTMPVLARLGYSRGAIEDLAARGIIKLPST